MLRGVSHVPSGNGCAVPEQQLDEQLLIDDDPSMLLFRAYKVKNRVTRYWNRLNEEGSVPVEITKIKAAQFESFLAADVTMMDEKTLGGWANHWGGEKKFFNDMLHKMTMPSKSRDPTKSPEAPPLRPGSSERVVSGSASAVASSSSSSSSAVVVDVDDDSVLHDGVASLFLYTESSRSWSVLGGNVPCRFRLLRFSPTDTVLYVVDSTSNEVLVRQLLDRRVVLAPIPGGGGNNAAWCWTAFDFANGDNLRETTVALAFETKREATMFANVFQMGQQAAVP